MQARKITVPALLVSVLYAGQALAAVTFGFPDFSSTAGLTLNGDAAQSGSVLRVVPSSESSAGTAYWNTPVPLDNTTAFSTRFEFLVTTDPNSSLGVPDGFTFLLQNDSDGANALGSGGEGQGYAGISPSVAVVFRGRGPSFIGVITDGTSPVDLPTPFEPDGSTSFPEGAFYEQNEFAWIDYDSSSTTLSVYLNSTSVKPDSPVMSTTVDVFGTLGSQAFVGFSAGNGGAFGSQDILNWTFVPEPAALSLLSLGAMALLRRRHTR